MIYFLQQCMLEKRLNNVLKIISLMDNIDFSLYLKIANKIEGMKSIKRTKVTN